MARQGKVFCNENPPRISPGGPFMQRNDFAPAPSPLPVHPRSLAPTRRRRKAVEAARQVIVKATAAAATIRTAVAAVSTVTEVASLASSQVRRVLKAACLGGMIGIAGRGSTGMEGSPRRECARNAHWQSDSPSRLVCSPTPQPLPGTRP